MRNFETLFGNQFNTGDIASDIHMKNYTEDQLIRYTHYNTSGQYDIPINLTEIVYTAFYGEITNQDVLIALRISRTRSVDFVMADFETQFTNIGNVISAKFPKTNVDYPEFFPHGLSEYHNLSKEKFPIMINRLKAAVDNHVALFDTVFVTLIHGFKTRYDNARGIQLTKKEDVTAGVITKADARLNLEKQLTINLLNLAIEFIDNPEQGWAFFNQNLLNPTHKHPQGGELKGKYVLDILTNVKTMADFKLKNETDYYLLLKNTSTELIFGYTCKDTSGNPIPITYFKLEPGASKIFSYAELGGMEYLFFYTESTEIVGQVTIEQVNAPMV